MHCGSCLLCPDDKATLTLLRDFPGIRGKIDILRSISTNFTTLGVALLNDYDGDKLTEIARQNQGKDERNNQVLMDWINGKGITDTTWGGLIKVLKGPCRNHVLADYIEEVVGR